MNQYVPKKVAVLEEYHPTKNIYPIKLDANESFLSLSPQIRAEILDKIIKFDFTKYPDPMAEKLCIAYSDYIGIPAENIVAGNGSDELISILTSCFLNKGDKVLNFSKDFSMYQFYADIYEDHCATLMKDETFEIDFTEAARYVKENDVKVVIFSNPCNPTGNVFSRETIQNFVKSVDCLVIVDEAYMDFSDQSIVDLCSLLDNLIVLRTCSKAFGLAAIRLGFAISNTELISCIKKVKSPFNVNSLTQLIGEIVITHKDVILENIRLLKENTQSLYLGLSVLSEKHSQLEVIYPTNTNFVYIKCPLAKIIGNRLNEEGIVVRTFEDGYLRISTGSKLQNDKLLSEIESLFLRGEYVYEKIRNAKKNKGN